MKVFKFGGGILKDGDSLRKLVDVIKKYQEENLLIVISAFNKVTNGLEKVIEAYYSKKAELPVHYDQIKAFHFSLAHELFKDDHPVFNELDELFNELKNYINTSSSADYDFEYDQIAGFGELFSSLIVHHYLKDKDITNKWFDSRVLIRTDRTFRSAGVNWPITTDQVNTILKPYFKKKGSIAIAQGFIGSTEHAINTTLGREGSDYSAAIFASILDADEVLFWKDVPGVLNADPRFHPDAIKLNRISYREAIEMTYYGAKVIHPKTIKPLQNKSIPLRVKSFIEPETEGTLIFNASDNDDQIPSFIMKVDQILISLYPLDFSFINAENLNHIFNVLARHHIRLNLMQNSAMSFSICIDNYLWLEDLKKELSPRFDVKYNTGLHLLTIRRYSDELIEEMTAGKEVLLMEKSRSTAQVIMKP